MRHKNFYDHSHANNYLSGSIIRIGELPVYVSRVVNNGKEYIEYYNLGAVVQGKHYLIPLEADEINLNPVPLGMLAYDKDARGTAWCSRIPARQWKVGLHADILDVRSVDKTNFKTTAMGRGDLVVSNAMKKTILGDYPSYTKARTLSNDNNIGVAFSRRFAIQDGKLYHTFGGLPVGDAEAKPVLYDDFSYLKEALSEDA